MESQKRHCTFSSKSLPSAASEITMYSSFMMESVVESYLVHTTIQLEYKTRLRVGIIIVRLQASIIVAFQYQFSTTVNQEHIFSPFQVLKYCLDCALVRLPGTCLISARNAQNVRDIWPGVLDNILNASYGGNIRMFDILLSSSSVLGDYFLDILIPCLMGRNPCFEFYILNLFKTFSIYEDWVSPNILLNLSP